MKLDLATLANLYPINALDPGSQEQLSDVIRTETHPRGSIIFEIGDEDPDAIFLLKGALLSTFADGRKKAITDNCNSARYPVGSLLPRKFTATVTSAEATVACVQRSILQRLLARTVAASNASVDVSDLQHTQSRDWTVQVMRSALFGRLPTDKIEAFFSTLESVPLNQGTEVIAAGETSPYYYVIAEGECRVEAGDSASDAKQAILNSGDSFGDQPLLDASCDARVVMYSDGVLMRLSAQDFNKLLQRPNVRWITELRAAPLFRAGQARLVDIRLESEHASETLKGSLNAPLYRLREVCGELDREMTYIVFCSTGSRSAAAAAIMADMGLNVLALTGGLAAVRIRKSKK